MGLGVGVWTLVLGGIGGLVTLVGVRYLWVSVRMLRSEPVDAREIRDPSATVAVAGEVSVHEETTVTPFTGTGSVLCEWTVEEYRGRSRSGSNWRTLAADRDAQPFVLSDNSGAVLVESEGATRELATTATIEVEADEQPPPEIARFLDASDRVPEGPARKRRYEESRLDPGDEAYVVGPVRATGHSFDMPGRVDAVVGAEDPGGPISPGDWLLLRNRFMITNSGALATRRRMLRQGLFWLVGGLFFFAALAGLFLFR